jgi:hypothetical protein
MKQSQSQINPPPTNKHENIQGFISERIGRHAWHPAPDHQGVAEDGHERRCITHPAGACHNNEDDASESNQKHLIHTIDTAG